ncbi:glycosyltransferase family A protein [Microbacterium marinilacus]|uniref:Glycosyltransferase 2-like domain-containing protein n=1 Tax=Microbacterium marinilacus TaxID=415209 RepID=A0ABP7B9U6_9MICO|nr:glycosyltransferase family A protein [Microbacterium marinilacus]MBY0687184.1 glycosyltransferase family 2 protein [Microbacterium marinilacus]
MSARVAVVVRTKDRPDFLRRALRSIASQTLEDWECAVVNDGGDAAAVDAVIAALPEAHRNRVSAVHHETSRGRWVSANAGVLATSAPLLVLHDDDDTWHPEFLERAAAYLDGRPDRAGVVSRIEIRWEELRGGSSEGGFYETVSTEMFQDHLPVPTLADTLLFNRYVPIGFVYRRSLHAELGLYDERLPVVGDWNFNLRVLARHALEYLDDATPYAYWHQRTGDAGAAGNSVIAARGDHAKYDALIRDEELRRHVDEHGLGLVLYLTKFIDRRFVEVEAGIRAEIRESRPVSTRLLERFRRLRRR